MSANKENNKFNSNQVLSSYENTECMICFESLADKNITHFKCGHFCCFDDAMKINDSNFCCPLCRSDLNNQDDKIEETDDDGVTQLLPPLLMPGVDDDDDSDDDFSSLDSEDMSSIRSIVDVKRNCNVCRNERYFCDLCFQKISILLRTFK